MILNFSQLGSKNSKNNIKGIPVKSKMLNANIENQNMLPRLVIFEYIYSKTVNLSGVYNKTFVNTVVDLKILWQRVLPLELVIFSHHSSYSSARSKTSINFFSLEMEVWEIFTVPYVSYLFPHYTHTLYNLIPDYVYIFEG